MICLQLLARKFTQTHRYRHTADRLQKNENVIEKYRKKLEDSAGMRRELRVCSNVSLHLSD